MKMNAKMIALCTAAALTLAVPLQSFAAENSFKDLDNVTAKDKILILQEKGYVHGIGDMKFAPNKGVTAAEGIQFIVNTLELNIDNIRFIKAPLATDYFTKADNKAWYADALIIASLNGFEMPTDIDLNQQMTKEEFTFQLVRVMEKNKNMPMINIKPAEIKDEEQMKIEYSGAIQRALVYKLTQLDAEGKFNPTAKITRAEAAEQLYNALEYLKAHPAPAQQ